MKNSFLLIGILWSMSFTNSIKSMDFSNYNGSFLQIIAPTEISMRDIVSIATCMMASGLYSYMGMQCAMNHYKSCSENAKKDKLFPKKAFIRHLKKRSSTKFNSRKKGFYKFGKR